MARASRARRPPALSLAAVRALRYGRRSMLQGAAALVALAALLLVSASLPGGVTNHSAVAGAYLLLPLLPLSGSGFALAGLAMSPRKLSPLLGLAANLTILILTWRIAMAATQ